LTLSGVETPVNLAFSPVRNPIGDAMENADLRARIRGKLSTGDLPVNGIPRFWVGPSSGEECNACHRLITGPFVVEGIATTDGVRKPIQMHVDCFALWDEERCEPREDNPRASIEAAILRRKEVFALSHLAWTASGYTVKFRLGVTDVVRTGVEGGVFEDPSGMDRMLDGVRRTFQSLTSPSDSAQS
jgi:hypothetical protein